MACERSMSIGHVALCVSDVVEAESFFSERLGFRVCSNSFEAGSVWLRSGDVILALKPSNSHAIFSEFFARHGDGFCDVSFAVDDPETVYRLAVEKGGIPFGDPVRDVDGVFRSGSIYGTGDYVHTIHGPYVEGPASPDGPMDEFLAVDHIAICTEPGGLERAVRFYESAFGFETIYKEDLLIGKQRMYSKAIRSKSGNVTITVVSPGESVTSGQLYDFLADHPGPGIQHIALSTSNIVRSVERMRASGVEFLPSDTLYYQKLPQRVTGSIRHDVNMLERNGILVDEDEKGQLFQVFTRSRHRRGTIFWELIERCGATTFGAGNIRALYNSVEATRERYEEK